jgi:hypothetical protein
MNGYEHNRQRRIPVMRALLRDMPAGVPADCLLSRIRGRRAFLVRDWDRLLLARQPLAALAAAPWRETLSGAEDRVMQVLQKEYLWAFSRMDEPLRRSTAPFFWLAEVRTLAVSLRLLSGGRADLGRLLRDSLLAGDIKDLLRGSDGCAGAVAELADLLAGYDPRFARLADVYRNGGPGAVEAALYEMSLQALAGMTLYPQIRRYLALVIDSRNLTTVAKRMRWQMSTIPPLLEGGILSLPRLAELFRRRDNSGLLLLAMRLGGQAPFSDTAGLERVLYEAQRRVMRRLAREDGVGTILDYLWRCDNEAANIGLLERLETAGIEAAGMELRR